MKPDPKIKILIADDHEVVRQGVRNVLEAEEDFELCAEATCGRDAVALCQKHRPQVAILDISMPGLNGIDAAKQILKLLPKIKIIIFTVHDAERLVYEVVDAGAHGYVLKSDAGRHLVSAVRNVLEGKNYFSSTVSQVLFDSFRQRGMPHTQPEAEEGGSPTSREREIIQLLAEGKSNKEVAAALGISVKTAETHRAAIMRKLGFHSIGELVRYAIRNHIIQP